MKSRFCESPEVLIKGALNNSNELERFSAGIINVKQTESEKRIDKTVTALGFSEFQ